MEPLWRITLLGGLTLSPARKRDGGGAEQNGTGEIRHFRSQKVAALLAYLALHAGRDCVRDVLCEALWPGDDPQETRNRLRVTLSSLRKQLEPPGVPPGAVLGTSVTNTVRLRAESVWVDTRAFETALRSDNLGEARSLWTGELLPAFYDDWILEERERLNALRERKGLGEAEDRSDPHDPGELAPPPPEKSDSPNSLDKPDRGGDAPRHRLPLYLTRFFGQGDERERLAALLTDRRCRLITLTGGGGQGKTRLSVETARLQRARPVWFVALADLWEGGQLAETIRDALGLTRSAGPAFDPLVAFLQAQTAPLLLLDNLEQIAPAAAPLLTALLEQVPELTLLVTSRVRLEIPGEIEIPVSPLLAHGTKTVPLAPGPGLTDAADLAALARLPAVALFVDRAQGVRPDFQLTPRSADDILGICQLLGGIPLGLELAAARSASFPPSQMRQKLTEHWNALPAVGRTEKTDRHRSLRAAIEWSVALLPLDQRRLFTQMSVFQGGATLEAIEAVCGAPSTLDTLTRLRASSLVQTTEQGGGFRYSLLEVLRQWAGEQQAPSDRDALAARHAAWYHRLVEERGTLFSSLSGVTALDEMEAETANFRAALTFCREENPPLYTELTLALMPFWEHKSHLPEAQKWLEAALFLTPGTEKRVSVLLSLGKIMSRQGDGNAALALLREAQGFKIPLPGAVQAAIHWATGRAYWVKGALPEALCEFQESQHLYEAQNDSAGQAGALSNIGVVLRDLGDYEGARTAFTGAIHSARAHDVPRTLATALDNFASLRHILGEEGVRELYQESLALKRALGMPDGVAVTLSNLALLHCREQDWAEGRRLTEEASVIQRETGNRRGMAISLSRLGQIADAEGRHDEAKRHFVQSLTLRLALGNPHDIIVALITFSEHAFSTGNTVKAARILGAVQRSLEEWGHSLPVDEDREYQQHWASVASSLSPAAFGRAHRVGAAWTSTDLPKNLQK